MKLMITFIIAFSVLSCSTSSNEKVRYKSSSSTPTLEIPPDLTALDDSENRFLPSSTLGTRAAVARYKDTGPLLERVLPEIKGVELNGDGDFHWLSVNQKPTELYMLLKRFWADEGFTLEQDEPLIGIMKTKWLKNRAGSFFSDDSTLKSMFSWFASKGIEDQYKVRIERGTTAGSVNVYLTQYGKEFVSAEGGNFKRWQLRAPDPELEVEMLSRMMLFLGLQDDQVKQQLAKIGKFPKRAQLIKSGSDMTSLVLKESFDRGWNKVLAQLDRLNVEYVSKNRTDSLIRFKQKEMDVSTVNANQLVMNIKLDANSDSTTLVEIVDAEGVSNDSDQAVALLKYLFEKLK